MAVTRIKLVSPDYQALESVCNQLLEIAKRSGVKCRGPVPLPTKKLGVSIRKSPCGGGTETFERREMRLHKRLIDIQADDTALSKIMRIQVPSNVNFSMEMKA